MSEELRRLPSLNVLLERRAVRALLRAWSRDIVRGVAREVLDEERERIRGGGAAESAPRLLKACETELVRRMEELAEHEAQRKAAQPQFASEQLRPSFPR